MMVDGTKVFLLFIVIELLRCLSFIRCCLLFGLQRKNICIPFTRNCVFSLLLPRLMNRKREKRKEEEEEEEEIISSTST